MRLNRHDLRHIWARFRKKLPPADKLPNAVAESLARFYPELRWAKKNGVWILSGKILFIASFDVKANELRIFQESDTLPPDFIRDEYCIELRFNSDFLQSAPTVCEIGGRVGKIAAKHKIVDLRDLHVNTNDGNSLCLYVKPEEAEHYSGNINLIDFIQRYVLPFFYGLSFFEKNKRWPWGEYGHGDVGIFEFYADRQSNQIAANAQRCYDALSQIGKNLVKGSENLRRTICPCGSGVLFRKCHPKGLEGLRGLRTFMTDGPKN